MARITASPNPVGVYSTTVGAKTTIEWDTEVAGGLPGKVVVLTNGVDEKQVAAGASAGNFIHDVTIPNTYTFILRRADNNAELARVTVTTYDLRGEMIAGFTAPYVPALRPQMITNLSVKPGVDTVRISFKTVRPTIPLTTLLDASGTKIDARFPLLGGLRTSHEAIFGVESPLELESKHSFRIVAAGPTGNKSSPKEAVVNGSFMSGKRTIDIFFNSVDVHDDGDPWPSGSGDLMFFFGAGDAETALPLGEPWPTYGPDDISDDDPPVTLNKQITIPRGPRQLWVQVEALENDTTYWPWDWFNSFSAPGRPDFTGSGSKYEGGGAVDRASAAVVLDIGSEPDAWTMAFDMATGDFPLDYVVSGHIAVDMQAGAVIGTKMAKPKGPLKFAGTLEDAGTFALVAARGAIGRAEALVLGPDGALHHRTFTRDSERRGDWTRIDLPGDGAVSVVASAPDELDLVFRHSDGSVSHQRHDIRRPKNGKWRKLGGNFDHVVPAIETSKGKDLALLLFGVEEDGSLHVRDARAGGDWDRLGDQPVGAIAPLSIDKSGPSLFAVSKDGTLLHFARQRGRWRSESIAAVPGRVPTLLLTAAVFDRPADNAQRRGQDVVIGALGEDHTVRVLRWPDYPAGAAEGRWEELGPLQDLAFVGSERVSPRTKASAKLRSPKRGAAGR